MVDIVSVVFCLHTWHQILISHSAKKSSSLDQKPTSLVVQCLDELPHVITAIINMSLTSGHFAAKWKEAIVTPLLKKPESKLLFQNLYPVSNLALSSKLTETAVGSNCSLTCLAMAYTQSSNLHTGTIMVLRQPY